MPRFPSCIALFGALLFGSSALAADIDVASYGYPLANPFEATIATTPPELRSPVPSDDDIDQADYDLKLRPERDQNLVVSYWRAGASDEEHVAAKKAEAAKG